MTATPLPPTGGAGTVTRREAALAALIEHAPEGPSEAKDLETTLAFARSRKQPFDRTDTEGHLVASGLVASPELDRVVLLHHRQLDTWLQCGGHADPEDITAKRTALREAREETGLTVEPHPAHPDLLDVDVHEIPATDSFPAHLHLDLRYLLVADPAGTPEAPADEAHEVAWFELDEARALELDEGLVRLLGKVETLASDG